VFIGLFCVCVQVSFVCCVCLFWRHGYGALELWEVSYPHVSRVCLGLICVCVYVGLFWRHGYGVPALREVISLSLVLCVGLF